MVAGSAIPWGGSGRVDRSGFELAALAGRLDLLDGPLATVARVWVLAPLVLALAVVLRPARTALATVLATALAAAGGTLALVVLRSPLDPRPGLAVTLAGTALVALGARRP